VTIPQRLSGYFSDPEGNRWEIACAPWLTEFE